jgi:hypothetical protein
MTKQVASIEAAVKGVTAELHRAAMIDRKSEDKISHSTHAGAITTALENVEQLIRGPLEAVASTLTTTVQPTLQSIAAVTSELARKTAEQHSTTLAVVSDLQASISAAVQKEISGVSKV